VGRIEFRIVLDQRIDKIDRRKIEIELASHSLERADIFPKDASSRKA
jgi:hypothetical protein